ncbi:MAG: cytochrome P450 [Bacteroidetes bacterium]|nr:cytochrome P450 [Bacteroidota bacterium]
MADSTRSALDPNWPPAPPAKGALADKIAYWIQWKNDQFFGILRLLIPIFRLPKGGPVLVTRFKDVQEVLSRPDTFGVVYAPMMDKSVGPFMLARDNTVYNRRDKGIMRSLIDDKDHPEIRKRVSRIASKCIQQGTVDGTLELVASVTRRAPILLTGKYFGFPGPDVETMMRWSKATQLDMFHNQTMSGKVHDDSILAGREMWEYITNELLPKRRKQLRKNPERNDIVSRMLSTQCPAHIGWDEGRIVSNIMGLLVGGIETTSQAVIQIVDELLSRPKQLDGARQAALHGDEALFARYCWEALRFNPINPVVFRQCNQDYRLASGTFRTKLIRKGRVVVVGTRSAMEDPREVARPRKFRTNRPDYQYLHLGFGEHRCLGDGVSMVQVPEIVKQIVLLKNLRRMPGKAGQIDFGGGPFPERFSVMYDA